MCLAVPGRVVQRDEDERLGPLGIVEWNGNRRRVSLALTPEAKVGDYVLVHVGVAIQVLDEQEAAVSLRVWSQL